MNTVNGFGKLEGEGMGTGLSKDLKGPKNFSESLCEGWVVQKNLALTKACCPTVKSGARDHLASAGPWYRS